MKAKKKERVVYFDILNIICMIAVVAMHVNAATHWSPLSGAWPTSLALDCIFYFAVPVFVMLSGATLYNYREKYDTKTFFKRRVVKIVIPLIFWSICSYLFQVYYLQSMPPSRTALGLLKMFLQNDIDWIFYFMFSILGIYLTMPFLSLALKKENNKELWLTVFLFFIINGFITNILALFNVKLYETLAVQLGGYVIYVILGYLFSTTDIKKKYRFMIYGGAIIGIIYRYLTTYILSMKQGVVVKSSWGYTSWHAILLASAVFLIVKELSKKINLTEKKTKILKELAGCSYGVYLFHLFVMRLQIHILDINQYSWKWRLFGIFTTYIGSLIGVYIMKRIPVIKKVVP